jgi:hypothetical protein
MKAIALGLALLIVAAAANAQGDPPRAKLIGRRLITSYPGAPILVCEYRDAAVKYEVVAAGGSCARYLALSAT